MKKGRGRPKKQSSLPEEKGNPAFNLNDAEPTGLTEEDLQMPENDQNLDLREVDKKVLNQAPAAITAEDLAFEEELQRMNTEPLAFTDEDMSITLTKEKGETGFLGDFVEGYKPAKTLNELTQQAFTAKNHGLSAIEATDDVIRYYTKGSFEQIKKIGYFIFQDIKVFGVGEFKKFVKTDHRSMYGA
jgi:hypothetical protein